MLSMKKRREFAQLIAAELEEDFGYSPMPDGKVGNLLRCCRCGQCYSHWFSAGWICTHTYENQTGMSEGRQSRWIKASPTNSQNGGEIDILAIYDRSIGETYYIDVYGYVREDLDTSPHEGYADSAFESGSGYISIADLEMD